MSQKRPQSVAKTPPSEGLRITINGDEDGTYSNKTSTDQFQIRAQKVRSQTISSPGVSTPSHMKASIDDTRIQVCVRFRPLLENETPCSWKLNMKNKTVHVSIGAQFYQYDQEQSFRLDSAENLNNSFSKAPHPASFKYGTAFNSPDTSFKFNDSTQYDRLMPGMRSQSVLTKQIVNRAKSPIRREDSEGSMNASFSRSPRKLDKYHYGKFSLQWFKDHVFDANATNEDVFKIHCKSIIKKVIQGYNGTIFAYGQTTSGKTHTMTGCLDSSSTNEEGIFILAMKDILTKISKIYDREFIIWGSYMEIYKEKVQDLMDEKNSNLRVIDDQNELTKIQGLQQFRIQSIDDVIQIIKQGKQIRHTRKTDIHECSSRSHTILRIIIENKKASDMVVQEQRDKMTLERDLSSSSFEDFNDTPVIHLNALTKYSVLNFVDLAGSERAKEVGNEARAETQDINLSLFQLNLVLNQLARGERHVSYRDSKLTLILKSALGGNSLTTLICTCSPNEKHSQITKSTLDFAQRASQVHVRAHVNEVIDDHVMLEQQKQQMVNIQSDFNKLKDEFHSTKDFLNQLFKNNPQLEIEYSRYKGGGSSSKGGISRKSSTGPSTSNFKKKFDEDSQENSTEQQYIEKPKTALTLQRQITEVANDHSDGELIRSQDKRIVELEQKVRLLETKLQQEKNIALVHQKQYNNLKNEAQREKTEEELLTQLALFYKNKYQKQNQNQLGDEEVERLLRIDGKLLIDSCYREIVQVGIVMESKIKNLIQTKSPGRKKKKTMDINQDIVKLSPHPIESIEKMQTITSNRLDQMYQTNPPIPSFQLGQNLMERRKEQQQAIFNSGGSAPSSNYNKNLNVQNIQTQQKKQIINSQQSVSNFARTQSNFRSNGGRNSKVETAISQSKAPSKLHNNGFSKVSKSPEPKFSKGLPALKESHKDINKSLKYKNIKENSKRNFDNVFRSDSNRSLKNNQMQYNTAPPESDSPYSPQRCNPYEDTTSQNTKTKKVMAQVMNNSKGKKYTSVSKTPFKIQTSEKQSKLNSRDFNWTGASITKQTPQGSDKAVTSHNPYIFEDYNIDDGIPIPKTGLGGFAHLNHVFKSNFTESGNANTSHLKKNFIHYDSKQNYYDPFVIVALKREHLNSNTSSKKNLEYSQPTEKTDKDTFSMKSTIRTQKTFKEDKNLKDELMLGGFSELTLDRDLEPESEYEESEEEQVNSNTLSRQNLQIIEDNDKLKQDTQVLEEDLNRKHDYFNPIQWQKKGNLVMCGDNRQGKCAQLPFSGPNGIQNTPKLTQTIGMWKKIACGYHHSVAIAEHGSIYAWGRNDFGQLGYTTQKKYSDVPKEVGGFLHKIKISQVACGYSHSLALTPGGFVFSWGLNFFGQLGTGDFSDRPTPQCVKNIRTKITYIDCGHCHSGAIDSKGGVYTWGANPDSRCAHDIQYSKSRGRIKSLKVPLKVKFKEEGIVIEQISFGSTHSLFLTSKGQVIAAGSNDASQLGTNLYHPGHGNEPYIMLDIKKTLKSPCKMVAAGDCFSIFLTKLGEAYTCGKREEGRLGIGGKSNSGSFKRNAPNKIVFNGGKIASVQAGGRHAMLETEDGRLYAWGNGFYHQLGNEGTNVDSKVPEIVPINDNQGPGHISLGYLFSAIILKDKLNDDEWVPSEYF